MEFRSCVYDVEIHFSKSLTIYQEKTKKISTVTMVWICLPNNHENFSNLSLEFLQELLII